NRGTTGPRRTGPRRSGCRPVKPAGPAAPRTFLGAWPLRVGDCCGPCRCSPLDRACGWVEAAAGCSEPVFSFEGEVEQGGQGGDEGGGGGESPVGGIAGVRQVLAVE